MFFPDIFLPKKGHMHTVNAPRRRQAMGCPRKQRQFQGRSACPPIGAIVRQRILRKNISLIQNARVGRGSEA
jgi:hypothetical protein